MPLSGSGRRLRDEHRSETGGPDEAAHYIRDVLAELSLMAHRHRHGMLGHLLDMAGLEADDILRQLRKPSQGR